MKAILMSIQSPHACNILNDIKLWEIRKKFPKDYVGWVYIYVTKGGAGLYHQRFWANGKVVARFWCDKVEEIQCDWSYAAGNYYESETFYEDDLLEKSCLTYNELDEYLKGKNGYAIHITKLETFDSPKEISEFWNKRERMFINGKMLYDHKFHLTRAPQSWCYIEI